MGWFAAAHCIRSKDWTGLAEMLKGEMDPERTLLLACRVITVEDYEHETVKEMETRSRSLMEKAFAGARSAGWKG